VARGVRCWLLLDRTVCGGRTGRWACMLGRPVHSDVAVGALTVVLRVTAALVAGTCGRVATAARACRRGQCP
jgi:hypothetical protein